MRSNFTIQREKVEEYVKANFEEILKRASIEYQLDNDYIESLGGDRHYELVAIMDVQLRVPVSALVDDKEEKS